MNRFYDGGDYFLNHPPDLEPIDDPPPAGLAGMTKGTDMTNADLVQQIARILALICTPLLIKWGIDSESATAIITGGAGLLGSLVWWFFWVRNKAKA